MPRTIWRSRTTQNRVASGVDLPDSGDRSPRSIKDPAASDQQTITVDDGDVQEIQMSDPWDVNLSSEKGDILRTTDEEAKIEADSTEDSPYESVRAAVRNTDGGEVANTVRAWILGMLFVTIASGVNMLLSMRYDNPGHSTIGSRDLKAHINQGIYRSPAISILAVVIQL
jgi:hypothetical protein